MAASHGPTQGIEAVTYNKVNIEWACRDSDFELNAWEHTQDPSEGHEDVEGGAELEFSVTVSVPAGVTAGKRCVALVVADEVSICTALWVEESVTVWGMLLRSSPVCLFKAGKKTLLKRVSTTANTARHRAS